MSTQNNPYEIKVQPLKNYKIPPWEEAVFTYQGDEFLTERYMQRPVLTHVKRLEGNKYQVIKTGEIKEYQTMDEVAKRKSKRVSLMRTMEELRGLIRTNFVSAKKDGSHKQIMITLTFRELVFDTKLLVKEFKEFIQRLEYENKSGKFGPVYDFAYIAVFEPHGSGAWHVHLLLKHCGRGALWIDKEDVSRIWRNGFAVTERLKASDAGAYYAAYFTCLLDSASNDGEEVAHSGEEIYEYEQGAAHVDTFAGLGRNPSKAMQTARKKGARLHHYPKHFKFYTCSRNIKRPEKRRAVVGPPDPDYAEVHSAAYQIVKVYEDKEIEPEVLNVISRRTYRKNQAKEV
jgi:hypothetical protein